MSAHLKSSEIKVTAKELGLTTLVYPHQTGGGPCDPKKGPNTLTNMKTFWMNEYAHGSTPTSLLQLQYHKATTTALSMSAAFGKDPMEEMRNVRTNNGDMNLDPFRIIIGCAPQFAAIATSEDWKTLKKEYEQLHRIGEECLARLGNKESAAQELITWVIGQKILAFAATTEMEDDERDRLVYEIVNLQSISPVQLANLERGHYQVWKHPGADPQMAMKAEMMTWACSWEVVEVIRKLNERRNNQDPWDMAGLHRRLAATATTTPAAPQNDHQTPTTTPKTTSDQAQAANNNTGKHEESNTTMPTLPSIEKSKSQAEDHPVYGVYFKMVKRGVPRAAVEQKMRNEGCEPAVLDDPSAVLKLSNALASPPVPGASGSSLEASLQTQTLKKTEARSTSSSRVFIASNPYESVLLSVMNNPVFKRRYEVLNAHSDTDDDDD